MAQAPQLIPLAQINRHIYVICKQNVMLDQD
jgi:hypothetical protein